MLRLGVDPWFCHGLSGLDLLTVSVLVGLIFTLKRIRTCFRDVKQFGHPQRIDSDGRSSCLKTNAPVT